MGARCGSNATRVRAIRELLGTWTGAEPSALPAFISEVVPLLGACQFFAYGLAFDGDTQFTEFMHAQNAGDGGRFFSNWLKSSGAPRYGLFDPRRPEPRQRNVALRLRDIAPTRTFVRTPSYENVFSFYGIEQSDQLRALVCEGPALLAWVGGFRAEPFTEGESRVLGSLIPALRKRLTLERHVRESALDRASLHAALEAIPAAAFLVTAEGSLRHANEVGRAVFDRERSALGAALADGMRAFPGRFDVTKIESRGLPNQYLAVMRAPLLDPAPRLVKAASLWRLTRRQTEVLGLLVRGRANKTIAATLACAESTIELHVTALLEKTQCESRTELVARIWSTI